ncbi:hypothetical protein ACLJJ6_04700 [Pediococcus siamensis]|uniref:hypothetical protein n=1 Tax=Pediococcus siamensis TaxID=381829 RepID=UPI0039A07FF0
MSVEQYKIKKYSPKFAKKTVTVMRKVSQQVFGEQANGDFETQISDFKNRLAKQYDLRIITSFNERTIYAVVIFTTTRLIELIVDPSQKHSQIGISLIKLVQEQSDGSLECETARKPLATILKQSGFQERTPNHYQWHQN